ncbi:MAG TPA: hypothetical protein VEQ66_11185 [Propionibacteriaceae bacterium]|nr:hypothetical protein [Propionibacteriaceae bacterium]
MSALWADAGTLESTTETSGGSRAVLRGLPRSAPRLARVPFLLVLIALFVLGMTGLLMLNTTLQNQAFQASTLHRQASELTYTQAGLESRLDQMAAPQELARRASAYGLRPNPYPAFLAVPSGKVLGKPQRVSGAEVPILIIKTPAELTAERAAAAARKKALAEQQVARAKAAAERAKLKAAKDKIKAAAEKKAANKKPANKKADAKRADGKKPRPAKATPGRG